MLSVPFERDIQKIAKINSQQEKPVSSNRKKLVSVKHKKSPIRKITDSRQNLVPHGTLVFLLNFPCTTYSA